jgi:hypothetical protein
MPAEQSSKIGVRVGNVRAKEPGEYVGRRARGRAGSPLGNPFRIGTDGSRDECIAHYRSWLAQRIRERDRSVLAELARLHALASRDEGVTLLCFCRPEPCHADVIRETLLAMPEAGEEAL